MKLLRYGPIGAEQPGLLDSNAAIRSLSGHVAEIDGAALQDLDRLRALNVKALPVVANPVRIGPCVSHVGKFVCIGLNYTDHARESGQPIPAEPVLFMKATSSISGPFDDVVIPCRSEKTDWEVELGVVIGRTLRYADEATAAQGIAGYCVVNDLSERAFQLERGGQWDKGKGCDTFGPIGPWLVTPEEIGPVDSLSLWLEVDGHRYQDASTASMIFKPAFLVSYVSQFMSLQPGDLISTGTPAGVGLGQKPPVYLRPGQTMQLGISGLGEQRQRTVAYRRDARS